MATARELQIEATRDQRWQAVFAAMAEGMVVHAMDGRILDANPAAAQILGLSHDQLLGKTSMDPRWRAMQENGQPLAGDQHPAMISLRTGKSVRQFIMGVDDGSNQPRWLSINSEPLLDDNSHQVVGAVATFTDVTLQKQLTAQLQQARTDLRAMLDHVPARICAWLPDATNRLANRQAEIDFGVAPGGATGKHVSELVSRQRWERAHQYFYAALQGNMQRTELVEPHMNEPSRQVKIEWVPKFRDGAVVGVYTIVTDITDLHDSRERIRELAQRLTTVREDEQCGIAKTLHEGIAQDLFATRMMLKQLQTESTGRVAATALCQKLQVSIDKCMQDIRQIAHELRPAGFTHLPLEDAIREHADYFASITRLTIDVQEEAPVPKLDEATKLALYRAVQELLANVAQHAQASQVTIVFKCTDTHLQIVLSDDGIGMSADARNKTGALGLLAIEERLRSVEGVLSINHRLPGGTEAFLQVPINS